jgi:hypothetical protein
MIANIDQLTWWRLTYLFSMHLLPYALIQAPNGERYPRVGGTRQRHFAGTDLKPRKVPKNAATPTRRVHAVLGCVLCNPLIIIPF